MIAQNYEIRVLGRLPRALRAVFAPLEHRTEDRDRVTVLAGVIGDQGELSGILSTLDSLGLHLLEIRPTEARKDDADE